MDLLLLIDYPTSSQSTWISSVGTECHCKSWQRNIIPKIFFKKNCYTSFSVRTYVRTSLLLTTLAGLSHFLRPSLFSIRSALLEAIAYPDVWYGRQPLLLMFLYSCADNIHNKHYIQKKLSFTATINPFSLKESTVMLITDWIGSLHFIKIVSIRF